MSTESDTSPQNDEIRTESISTNPEPLAICCQCYYEMKQRICEKHEHPHVLCFECLLASVDLELEMEIKKEDNDGKWACREKRSRERGWEYGSCLSDGY
jgi:hypothetical protein